MDGTHSALELARAAGYTIRAAKTGGLVVHEELRLLEVGPQADDLEILRVALRHLMMPTATRATDCACVPLKRLRSA